MLRAIRHPEYNQQSNVNDIMLLQVRPTRPSSSPAEPVHSQCRGAWPSWEAEEEAGAEPQGGHGVLHTPPLSAPSPSPASWKTESNRVKL